MYSLNLEDFSENEKKPDSQNVSKEEIEKYYQNQIKKLKEELHRKVEEAYKKGKEEGIKEGKEETERYLKEQFQKELLEKLEKKTKEITEEYEQRLSSLISLIDGIKEKYSQHVQFTDELILSVIEEIMEYLYIDPGNAEYIAKEIRSIIEDLKTAPEVVVEVSPQLKTYLERSGINLKIIENSQLEGGDFVIKIENVQFENRFKEKVKILKDEIKREIKKNSPL
ncbi:hypothetical protein GWK41_05260 [Persephonella atlantica]|uniref:Flagellar assembly protein FliH/Type III secretion system HrpE domain-containing protein n=1 Tax=Persephonella atlantica TaxID=2699429 RepID=A0ABS1GHR3_9AQUI|nr:hypothetical protein [Persephonella atlantica]MBK3332469.1 hypothetical protein [Persephonella atlantica]